MCFIFKRKRKTERLLSFTKEGYLKINSRRLRQTSGYKKQVEQAEILAKTLNLPNHFE